MMRRRELGLTDEVVVVAVDHGYGNIKGVDFCFPSGVVAYDYEPTFNQDVLFYEGKYYQIGADHKEFQPNKIMDEDYYILTLAAIACELKRHRRTEAKVHLAVGLPLTWVSEQKEAFKDYLLQKEEVEFSFHEEDYHIRLVGADVFPQGFAAVAGKLKSFKGVNMLVDIGNGTMNIMYINNGKPVERKCYTEKYGTNQCVMVVRESILKQFGKIVDDTVIQQVLRYGSAEISERYLDVIRAYVEGIFRKLREKEYDPELMRLYVVGGGGCLIENFADYDSDRVFIEKDICATARGFEMLSKRRLQKEGVKVCERKH